MKNSSKKKGFTLAELLVVVAIIAVLVAVSIPIFTSQLKKATKATNEANLRAAKGAAVSTYLSDSGTGAAEYNYDVVNGKIKAESVTLTSSVTISDATEDYQYTKIGVKIDADNNVVLYAAKE